MAATKDNTSKTAHVMNLLSRTRGGAAADTAAPAPEQPAAGAAPAPAAPAPAAPQAAPAPAAPVAPILSSMEADAAVSNQIKDALEGALASALEEEGAPVILDPPVPAASLVQGGDTPPAAMQWPEWGEDGAAQPEAGSPAPAEPVREAPAPAQAAPVQPAPATAQAAPAQPASAAAPAREAPISPAPTPAQAAPVPSAPPSPAQAADAPKRDSDDDISCFNVMEALVEDKVEKYMKMYGMCQCRRCTVDVKATALNGLPGKYVVMGRNEFIPRISVYEGRFAAAVTAQLLRACKLVSDNPHHDRPA